MPLSRMSESDDEFMVSLMFPDEYTDFIAEICYKSEFICRLHQERGPGNFSIEFGEPSGHPPLDGFLRAIESARRGLFDYRKQE